MQTFLSQTAEYALRAMARIAAQKADEPLLARNLSVEMRIPQQYLSKILRRLVLAGILTSKRGRGGGFTLVRPSARIILRDVLKAVDAYPEKGRCAFGLHACSAKRPCALHDGWARLSDDFHRWAAKTTFGPMHTGAPTLTPSRRRRTSGRALPVVKARARTPRRAAVRTLRAR